MKSLRFFLSSAVLVSLLTFLAPRATASDPVGIYALVDRVVLEPKDEAPERIQVWGAFSIADAKNRHLYQPTQVGYLYFALPTGEAKAGGRKVSREVVLAEWSDLKKLAGKGECVAMGSRGNSAKVRVRPGAEKPTSAEEYPVGYGLQRMVRDDAYPPIRDLRTIPLPASPADGEEVKPGAVTLKARNILDSKSKSTRYVFEIEKGSGEKEASKPVEAGEKVTDWTPSLQLRPGEKCTWRVWAVEGDWKGPVASSRFQVKASA